MFPDASDTAPHFKNSVMKTLERAAGGIQVDGDSFGLVKRPL